jgi:molecular chaperone DnaK
MSERILGIDLGTTNSLVGVVDSGFPILLADEDGARLMPSAVFYPEDGGIPLVGSAALRMQILQPGRTVTSAKRHMGERGSLAEAGMATDPESVSAVILARLKEVAERAMGEEISKAVITVPAYFNDAQRSATRRAGESAGLEVVRILSEPTAAALFYGLDKLDERSKVAVYDFGGGTFDVSVLELHDGVFQVLATDGDTRLGGDDLDGRLAAHLFEIAAGGEIVAAQPEVRARFMAAAKTAKETLSEGEVAAVRLPFYDGENTFEHDLSRDEFEALVKPIVDRTRSHCHKVLAAAGVTGGELDAVVLVGGSTRLPLVRRAVAEVFGQAPDLSQNPDEAVGLGAVIQAGVLSGALRDIVLLDVTPLSLGVETFGGLMNVVIPRNTTIPVKRGELFTNAVSGQRAMKIRVLQGEREMARDNWLLGEFEIEFEAGPKGSARVGVQFSLDADGILSVLARDTATGVDRVLEIRDAAVDVDDEKVGEMVSESVEFAFEDMNERIWTEAKLKSEELLPAVASALEIAATDFSEGDRAEIAEAVSAVEMALERGVVAELKKANSDLDRATEHLAAILVERALEG